MRSRRVGQVATVVLGVVVMACKQAPSSGGGAGGNSGAEGGAGGAGGAGSTSRGAGGAAGGATRTAAGRPFAAPATPSSATPIVVTSTTFASGGMLPVAAEFDGCGGKNVSPQVSWSGAPASTKSFVLTAFDPDAPTSTGYWHWVVFNIPATVTSLPAGAGTNGKPVTGAQSGYTDFGFSHYGGPCPPSGDPPHHYIFTVYALDVPTVEGVGPQTTAATVMFSLRGHLLAQGSVEGQFARQ